MRDGNFSLDHLVGFDLAGKTAGVVGTGRIGAIVARLLWHFRCEVLAHDPIIDEGLVGLGVHYVGLDELFARSHVVTLNCPLTAATHHLVDAARLRATRPGAMLVNTTRGKIVDNHALHDALTTGHLAMAALDDTEEEPAKLERWSPATNPLFSHPNCFITPHVAYVSVEALTECRRVAAENARAVLLGEPPPNPVPPR